MEGMGGRLRPFPGIAVPVVLPKAEEAFMDVSLGFRQGPIPLLGRSADTGDRGLMMIGVEEGKVGAEAGEQEKDQAEEPGAAAARGWVGPFHGCFRG
jgi:hypothetical protein